MELLIRVLSVVTMLAGNNCACGFYILSGNLEFNKIWSHYSIPVSNICSHFSVSVHTDSSDLSSEWQNLSCSPQSMGNLLLSFEILHGNLLSNTECKLSPFCSGTLRRRWEFQIVVFWDEKEMVDYEQGSVFEDQGSPGLNMTQGSCSQRKKEKRYSGDRGRIWYYIIQDNIAIKNLSASQVIAIKHTRSRGGHSIIYASYLSQN